MPAPRKVDSNNRDNLVAHLSAQAQFKPVNDNLSLGRYFTSAGLLLNQVSTCLKCVVLRGENML